jgi:hypothetical protein
MKLKSFSRISSKLNEQRQQFLWQSYLEKSVFRPPNNPTATNDPSNDARAALSARNSFFIPSLSHFWSASVSVGYSSAIIALALKKFWQYLAHLGDAQLERYLDSSFLRSLHFRE